MGNRLAGKVAIVTGGASGMGRAQCKLFASEGAAVCVADIDADAGQKVVDEIVAAGGRALFTPLNVVEADQWAAAVAAAEENFGAVTTLSNIAGANYRVSFDEQTEEMWRNILEISLTGAFLGIKAVVPAMRRAGNGSIINIGSIATSRAGMNPGYSTSKVGILGLTKATASAYAADNIRCNLVSPGHVDTPFIRRSAAYSPNSWATSIDNPDNLNSRIASTPMGRLVQPEEVAYAFLFLATDEAGMITGTNLKVDGGASL